MEKLTDKQVAFLRNVLYTEKLPAIPEDASNLARYNQKKIKTQLLVQGYLFPSAPNGVIISAKGITALRAIDKADNASEL